MRTFALIATALALLTSTADSKPRRGRAPHADTAWVRTCIHERTGPTDGVSATEARQICRAEQPDDEVSVARQGLALARANAKVAKAKVRVVKAVRACEQAIVDRCVEGAAVDGSTNCMDSDLWPEFVELCAEQGKRPEGGN